jgi:hypothetical protein
MHRVQTGGINGATGDSSDMNGTYLFQDGNASLWSEAANGDSNYIVSSGTYAASGMGEGMVDLNGIFGGEMTNGNWTFSISDNNETQMGSFVQTSVEFVSTIAIPEPGPMAAVVLGTLFGGIMLRRRQQKRMLELSNRHSSTIT